ncbi:hypothetical protein K439DRAFT_387456 [Ramaria rubella]|nr:hypothetical protein K439DRAFT_387456 [Ramaria rubella]
MLPITPIKKPFTNERKNAIDASNMHRDANIPEDLSIALQSLGSRVRKSVTEGYNTQRVTSFTVPLTPYSSPAKPPATQTIPIPIFRSANEALNVVFTPENLCTPLTPSPRKRRRADAEHDAEQPPCRDGDVDMDGESMGSDDEDDPVMVILGPDANSSLFGLPRKIKPLRRSMAWPPQAGAPLDDPFLTRDHALGTDSCAIQLVQDAADMDLSGGMIA